ncbi:MAG: pyridoxamine 5'-phosphate oxidase [Thiolinea sp.]
MMDIGELRNEYKRDSLDQTDLCSSPFAQFEKWFQQARDSQVLEINAMQLATATTAGRPSVRTVLMKAFDEQGFVFYTNYGSQKAREITENPLVSALFFWKELERQVEITGKVEKVATSDSLKYFLSRPKGSQLGAWVSPQSSIIESRQFLEQKLAEMKHKFSQGDIPLPDYWGGFRIIPDTVEFWQGRPNRLHDRFEYRVNASQNWDITRLAP